MLECQARVRRKSTTTNFAQSLQINYHKCEVRYEGTMVLGPTPTRLRQIALVAKDLEYAKQLLVGYCSTVQLHHD